MEFILFSGGVLLGIFGTLIYKTRERIHGVIHIDHETDQCIFNITSEEVSKRNKKIAVFYINHDANISREEQGL